MRGVQQGGDSTDTVGMSLDDSTATTGKVATRLLMGSADPHGLAFEERSAPMRKRPTFSSMAHARASDDELLARPFADFNVPPDLPLPRPLPEQPEGEPPVVTRVEQVLPYETRVLINKWIRRLRRCMKLARAGNMSLARRMRPPDLWLPASKHMTDETRQWNWDFTPLARGEPARPWAVSGRDGVMPSTDLDLVALANAMSGFADQQIIAEVIAGFGDDAECERGTLLCAPHVSALNNLLIADEKLEKSLRAGWAIVGELPAWPIRACPYGLVDESERAGKIKWRLTNNLSWPPPSSMSDGDGGFVQSLNGSMDRSEWPENSLPRVAAIAEAAAIFRTAGAPVKLWGFDCEAFYKRVGRQLAQLWKVGMMRADGRFQIDTRCCFGSAADAAKCSRLSNFLAHEMRQAIERVDARYPTRDARILAWEARRTAEARSAGLPVRSYRSLSSSAVYIDDAMGVSFDDQLFERDGTPVLRDGVPLTRATAHFEAALAAVERFGFTSAKDKEQWPRVRAVMLGIELDVLEGWLRLEDNKRKIYLKRVQTALQSRAMRRPDYLRLIGRLQFASMCLPRGRQWLHAAWRASRTRFRTTSGKVMLTKSVIRDLRLWEEALMHNEAELTPLAHAESVGAVGLDGVGAMYADASGKWGWAAWTCVDDTVYMTEHQWSEAERELDISVKEMIASTVGARTLWPYAEWRGIYNYTDNMTVLAALRSGTPSTRRLQVLTMMHYDWLRVNGLQESPERVGSKSNLWADLASRNRSHEVVRQAKRLSLSVQRVDVARGWESAEWLTRIDEGGPDAY